MLLSFRQGIVQYEAEGFLLVNGATVSLVVNDTPTVVTIANGNANYLHVEHTSYPNAWSITGGVDQWLYWDIHSTHATRTFGVTLVEPVASAFAPESPVADLHWFDTTNNIMKVWQNNRWYNKIRVFACKLSGGSVATSISLNYPRFDGTQVGINTSVAAGSIMFDSISGKPLRANDKFITTEDIISTVPLTKSDVKVESVVVSGEAQLPMARYTAVYFAEFGRITHATDALMTGDYIPVGILQRDCVSGDVIDVTMTGVVTAYEWDWSVVGINAPLYINSTGQITPVKTLNGQRPVGYVVDTRSIVLGMTNIQSYVGSVGASLLSELGDVTLSVPADNQVLTYNGTEWVNEALPAPITDLNALTDVVLTAPADNQVLTYTGSEWVNEALPTPITDLNALTDVTLTTPTSNHYLRYNGSQWINSTIPTPVLDDLADVVVTTPQTADILSFNGISWVNTPPAPSSPITWNATNETLYGPSAVAGSLNTVYGNGALATNTIGTNNVVVGTSALALDANSYGAVAIGYGALQQNTTLTVSAIDIVQGYDYVIVDPQNTDFTLLGAADNNIGTIFTANSTVPTGTGVAVDMGSTGMVAIGYNALHNNTSNQWDGQFNIAIGWNALYSNTIGYCNTAQGYRALYSNTTGSGNIAIGQHTLGSNLTGFSNTGIGWFTLNNNTTGYNNTIMGNASGQQNTTGSNNTALGSTTIVYNTTGNGNVAVGEGALLYNTTGSYNTTVGYQAGSALTDGDNNTLIGRYAGTAGMAGNIVLSTGDGTVRLQHNGTNWTSSTPISTTGLILPSTTSPITLNSSTGTAGQVLTSAGPGATPTWSTASKAITINTQATNYVLQVADAYDTLIRMTSSSANTVTIPNDSTADLPIGAAVLIGQNGTGQTSIVAAGGVTVVSPDSLNIGRRYGKITAIKVAANSWEIEGNLAP